MLTGFLEALFNGISIGAVLLVAALGLSIIFGLMGVINMAHGELMMLGAYTTFVVQLGCKQLGGIWFDSYIFLALIIAFLVTALVGLVLERGVISYLYGRPLETLLATWGVSLIFQQFCPQCKFSASDWYPLILRTILWGCTSFKLPSAIPPIWLRSEGNHLSFILGNCHEFGTVI